jgi:hypothetical protein
MHSHSSGLQAIQHYRYSTHFTVHRCTRSLHQSYPGNGVRTVSLSLQITHGVFFSQPNSFVIIVLQLPIPKTRLNSIPSLYPGRLASRNSTLQSRLLFCTRSRILTVSFYNPSARTPRKTACIVDEACLPRRCLAINVLLSRSLTCAGVCSPSRCVAMGIHVTISIQQCPVRSSILLQLLCFWTLSIVLFFI